LTGSSGSALRAVLASMMPGVAEVVGVAANEMIRCSRSGRPHPHDQDTNDAVGTRERMRPSSTGTERHAKGSGQLDIAVRRLGPAMSQLRAGQGMTWPSRRRLPGPPLHGPGRRPGTQTPSAIGGAGGRGGSRSGCPTSCPCRWASRKP